MGENPIPQNGNNFIIGRNAMDMNESCHAIYLDLDWERLERYYKRNCAFYVTTLGIILCALFHFKLQCLKDL